MVFKDILPLIVAEVLVIGLVLMGGVLYSQVKKNAFLEVQVQTSEVYIRTLEQRNKDVDSAVTALDDAKETFRTVQADIKSTIKKAMKDETYKLWHDTPVHGTGIRMLREAADSYGTQTFTGTNGTDAEHKSESPAQR